MKKTKAAFTILLAALFLLAAVTPAFVAEALPKGAILVTNSDTIKANDFTIIAHRGLSACAPAGCTANT